jgi:hypothetical protein
MVVVVELLLNVAVTLALELIVIEHGLVVPVQVLLLPPVSLLQPANVEVRDAPAVRVTGVPEVYVAEQLGVQLMPPVLLVTVPDPVPASVTVSV